MQEAVSELIGFVVDVDTVMFRVVAVLELDSYITRWLAFTVVKRNYRDTRGSL
jgi:hypothetical protein